MFYLLWRSVACEGEQSLWALDNVGGRIIGSGRFQDSRSPGVFLTPAPLSGALAQPSSPNRNHESSWFPQKTPSRQANCEFQKFTRALGSSRRPWSLSSPQSFLTNPFLSLSLGASEGLDRAGPHSTIPQPTKDSHTHTHTSPCAPLPHSPLKPPTSVYTSLQLHSPL